MRASRRRVAPAGRAHAPACWRLDRPTRYPSGAARARRFPIRALSAAVTPTAPFAFDLALRYLQTSPSAVVELIAAGAYHRAVRLREKDAVLRVRAGGDGGGVLRVDVLGDGLTAEHLVAGVTLAERVFGTRAEMAQLEEDVAADPVFAAVARRFRGLRPVLIADPFETLVWAILGQQINVVFAAKLKRALIERFGTRVRADGHDLRLFPEPETLARLDHARDLRPLQFSRQKSEYTIAVARAIADGRLDLEALRAAPPDEALARLMELKGIGRWTAEYMLLRGFGHRDAIPAADGGLKRAVGTAYGLGRLAAEAEVRALAQAWAPWRGYAAFYWWFTLQLEAEQRRLNHTGAMNGGTV